MTINFDHTLGDALEQIEFTEELRQFLVHEEEQERDHNLSCEIIEKYGNIKWQIVDLLNEKFSHCLTDKFDLYNWINLNANDELSYFLNEAGSNCLNYSQYKAPYRFHLWLGVKGFVVAIEQKGTGFNAQEILDKGIKTNEGAAFDFFKNCRSKIFFDNHENAKTVFMQWKN
jgi:hypothetical protein